MSTLRMEIQTEFGYGTHEVGEIALLVLKKSNGI
jgi:hypothetical protein